MYKTIKDFLDEWAYETASTSKMMGNLTDETLNQKVTPEGRTLGYIAWHIAGTIPEMMNRTGLNVKGSDMETPPASAAEIKKAYDEGSASLVEEIKNKWNDETLNTTDDMYGMTWTKAQTLNSLVKHEAHHRGQMTILMRQAGLRVPGVYGPAKEEWIEMGMEAMP